MATKSHGILITALAALLAVTVVASVCVGPADIAPGQVWSSIAHHLGWGETDLSPVRDAIIWELRLPRVLVAAMVGAGLALCGLVMQAVTRNPLADPYLLGLSSGGVLGAIFVLLLGWVLFLPMAAFAGSVAALVATLGLARAAGQITPGRTILAGIAVSAFASAIGSFLIFWHAAGDSYREILTWFMGSVSGSDWVSVGIASVALGLIGPPILLSGRTLDAFTFGDTAAAALGIPVARTRWVLLVATALITGAMVSVSGAIGFIGLVIPHVARALSLSGNRHTLPVAALIGAIGLTWADTLARTAFAPREFPVGIVTALVGAPAFALLMLRTKHQT